MNQRTRADAQQASCPGSTPGRRRGLDEHGYTAVEVIMALALFMIGAMGILSMQKVSVQGNQDARKYDIATAMSRAWLERLARDASVWTLPSATNPSASNFANALVLNHVDGAWRIPVDNNTGTIPDGVSPAFDIVGRDLKNDQYGGAHFCTHVRLSWLVQNELLRAEVRVFWPRARTTANVASFCDSLAPATVTASPENFHFLYAATALRRNPVQ